MHSLPPNILTNKFLAVWNADVNLHHQRKSLTSRKSDFCKVKPLLAATLYRPIGSFTVTSINGI